MEIGKNLADTIQTIVFFTFLAVFWWHFFRR